MKKHYYSFNEYLREKFGERVQRISLNAGFTCPNRDGTLSSEGCIFCNDEGFSPVAKTKLSLEKQIEEAINLSQKRFKAKKFIAYFQNATGTYESCKVLKKTYDTIKAFPDIVGLFISTRPDAIDEEKLDLIESYSKDYEVWIEYGVQTTCEATLEKINRKHTFKQSLEAIEKTKKRNIKIGAHVILGLPGESRNDMLKTADTLAGLSVDGIKLHVLHILCDTKLAEMFKNKKVKLLNEGEYVGLACDFLERINSKCVVLRLVSDAKEEVLVEPRWINSKQKIITEINNEFEKRKSFQGSMYGKTSMRIR